MCDFSVLLSCTLAGHIVLKIFKVFSQWSFAMLSVQVNNASISKFRFTFKLCGQLSSCSLVLKSLDPFPYPINAFVVDIPVCALLGNNFAVLILRFVFSPD
ncbi:MAG: hypothetical protein MUO22_06930 [Sedimentisphaerales bacterium]|nr:hypothetical protein [Sedimentisphaerales bacterium]